MYLTSGTKWRLLAVDPFTLRNRTAIPDTDWIAIATTSLGIPLSDNLETSILPLARNVHMQKCMCVIYHMILRLHKSQKYNAKKIDWSSQTTISLQVCGLELRLEDTKDSGTQWDPEQWDISRILLSQDWDSVRSSAVGYVFILWDGKDSGTRWDPVQWDKFSSWDCAMGRTIGLSEIQSSGIMSRICLSRDSGMGRTVGLSEDILIQG